MENGDKLRKKDLTERGFYGMNLSGTRTEQNLLAAFAGESMAANKYDFTAVRRRKKAMNRSAPFSRKQQTMNGSMPNRFSVSLTALAPQKPI